MKKEIVEALFLISGFKVKNITKIPNQYWSNTASREIHEESPWWDVETEAGIIRIGRRKRVFHIDWKNTGLQFFITADEVTKNLTFVHSYSHSKNVEYLTALNVYYHGIIERALSS